LSTNAVPLAALSDSNLCCVERRACASISRPLLLPCATGGTSTKNPLDPGHYCFRATWPGDTNYVGAKEFDGATECFNVVVISTSVTTHQFYYPNYSATVSAASGTLPNGNVTFRLYGPTDGATPQTALQNCTADGGTLATGMLYSTTQAVISAAATVSTNNTSVKGSY
jgi:hypothetical protein